MNNLHIDSFKFKNYANGVQKVVNMFSSQPSWTCTIMLIDKQISNGQKKEEKSYSSYDGHCSGVAENSAGVRSHVELRCLVLGLCKL